MDTQLAQQSDERSWRSLLDPGRLRAYGPAVLTLFIGLAASLTFFQLLRVRDEQTAKYVFGEQAKTYIRSIERVLDANVNAVRWSAVTLGVSKAPSEEVFQRYLAALRKDQANTLTLCWISANGETNPEPENHPSDEDDANRDPAGAGVSYPIATVYSVDPNRSFENVIGFDLATDPDAVRYLEYARETGKSYVVSNSARVKELFGPSTALVVSAVHVTGEEPTTPDPNNGRFIGFVAGAFQIEKVVDLALIQLNQERANLDVFDEFAQADQMAIYHRTAETGGYPDNPVLGSELLTLDRMHYTGPVELASTRRWLFVCTPTRAHLAEAYTWQPLLGLLAGLSLTAVVFEHFLAQIRQRRKAEALVQRRTAELQRTNERLTTEVAARKQFEAERDELLDLLEQSNESLQHLNRRLAVSNSDLQDFAVIASHDLKEPLRKVRALAENLRRIVGDGPEQRAGEYVDLIDSCTERMQRLITNILQVSRVTTHGNPFTLVDLTQIAHDVVGDLTVRIQETGGTVDVQPLPVIEADPMQMRQLMQNLIDNGLKYGTDGAPPKISVFAKGDIQHDRCSDYCEICVQDEGPGIDLADADRIFALFQRVNGNGSKEGSGVGLAVCRKIAERHGGSIKAERPIARGTRFTVVLPVAQSPNSPAEDVREAPRVLAGSQ